MFHLNLFENILIILSDFSGGISAKNIRTIATSTSVSLNWNVLSSDDISVSISLNNSSQIMQNNIMVYEWNDLKPATLYDFTLEFKQLHLDFIIILQRVNVQVETGIWIFGSLLINIFIIYLIDNMAVILFS